MISKDLTEIKSGRKERIKMIRGKQDDYPTLSEILQSYSALQNKVENFVNMKPGFFFVFSAEKIEGSRGPYYICTVGDSRIRIESKAWIGDSGVIEPRAGHIALADYMHDEKYGLSIKVKRNFTPDEMEAYSAGSITKLIPVISNIAALRSEIQRLIESVKNEFLRELLDSLLGENGSCQEFFDSPAAKTYHHALIGGLASHSLQVARYALGIYEFTPSRDSIDRDILVVAALLHDIGKVKTYSTDDYAFEYTDRGQLEEHIAIGVRILERAIVKIDGFPETLASELIHAIISHHGELQYGSPVTPKTREAFILALCDNLDARLDHFESMAAVTQEDSSWTEYSRMFQSRLYKGNH